MKLVVDADQMIYACGFASEGEPRSHTYKLLNNAVESILEETGASEYEIYIGGKGNFREDIAVTQGYKANRTAPKPESYDDARQFLIDRWNASVVEGMETDDMVSILLYQDYVKSGGDPDKCNVTLSSPDKDLNNTPGWHYNPQKNTLNFITDTQAERHFWWQVLCGDATDNIKGLPYVAPATRKLYKLSAAAAKGCGAGSATKIMQQCSGVEGAKATVIGAYLEWGVDNSMLPREVWEYMLEQCQLLWMVRELDEFDSPVMFDMSFEEFCKLGEGYLDERDGDSSSTEHSS